MEDIFESVVMGTSKSKLFFDCEMGKALDYNKYKPTFKEPRITAKGTIHASDKLIEEQESDWKSKCCIEPITGRIILYGWISTKADGYIADYENIEITEKMLLKTFWQNYELHDLIVGFDIKRFDLPYIMLRSMKHGVKFPIDVIGHRYFNEKIIDLREILACGRYPLPYGSLDVYSKYFGLPDKDMDVSKNFEDIWLNDKTRCITANKIEVTNIQSIFNIINQ